jgi:hypothetical protein
MAISRLVPRALLAALVLGAGTAAMAAGSCRLTPTGGPGYFSTFYDPKSVRSREIYWRQIRYRRAALGVDAWWMDATEPDHSDRACTPIHRRKSRRPAYAPCLRRRGRQLLPLRGR